MKTRISSLLLLSLCLTLAAVPVMAGELYSNGPSTLTADAWTINFGFAVSDSFTIAANANANQMNFIVWLTPGDTMTNVDLSIGTSAFGNDVANFLSNPVSVNSDLGSNQFGFDVVEEQTLFPNTPLTAGTTYWVTLQNAVTTGGNPVYWDENSGPSMAQENSIGTIPSESFTIQGGTSTTSSSTTPEPSSIMLFGSGILGLASLLRQRVRK